MPSRLRAALCAALLLLVVQCFCAPCVVRLDINTTRSSLNFTGISWLVSTPSLRVTYSFANPSVKIGLQGALYAIFPSNTLCPTDAQTFTQQLINARIATTPNPYYRFDVIDVYPPKWDLLVAGLPYQLQNVALNITLEKPVALATSELLFNFQSTVVDGMTYSNTPVYGTLYTAFENYTSQGTTAAKSTAQGTGTAVELRLPKLQMNFTATNTDSTTPGTFFYTYTADLVLQGNLGCPQSCGDYGRCMWLNGTYGCECQCGYAVNAAGQCNMPSGFCPEFGAAPSSLNVIQINGTANMTNSTTCGSSIEAVQGSCPSGYGYNMTTQQCDKCSNGWGGVGCKLCQDDQACVASSGSSTSTCEAGLQYAERTVSKEYACSVKDESLTALLGYSVGFSCSTTGNGTTVEGDGLSQTEGELAASTSYCQLQLWLAGMSPGQYAACRASDCTFEVGSPDVTCGQTSCSCPKGCSDNTTDWLPAITQVSGGVMLQCEDLGEQCSVELTSLNLRLDVSCTAAECYDSSAPITIANSTAAASNTYWVNPVVAAVPLMVLLLLGGACTAALAACYPYVRTTHGPHGATSDTPSRAASRPALAWLPAPKLGPGSGTKSTLAVAPGPVAESMEVNGAKLQLAGMAPAKVIEELRFTGIWCKVKLDGSAAKRARWQADRLLPRKGAVVELPEGAGADVELAGDSAALNGRGANGAEKSDAVGMGKSDVNGANGQEANGYRAGGPVLEGRWKTILQNVNGSARARELLGVLGPSGGGKSTLLAVLTGQVAGGGRWAVGGALTADGAALSQRAAAGVSAFVAQDDHLLRALTVEECLSYSAALRLDTALTHQQVRARVDAVLSHLHLDHVRHSCVWIAGGATAGVSGGERRRVSIGMELVTSPSLLVLDEPTSGLDSYSALALLRTLAAVATEGRVVVLSMHQPSPAMYDSLDQVLLMAQGYGVYFGPPGGAADALSALGLPCPAGVPLAEHMLHVVSDADALALIWPRLEAAAAAQPRAPLLGGGDMGGGGAHRLTASQRVARAWRQAGVLFWRSGADMVRNPMLLAFHTLLAAALGLLVGGIFYDVQPDTSGAQNTVGAMFFSLSLLGFTSVTSLDLVQAERGAVEREIQRGYYSPGMYMLTKLVLDNVLLRALPAVLFGVPLYFLMDLRPGAAYVFTYLLVLTAFNATMGAASLALGVALRSPGQTVLAMNVFLLIGVLFAGFLANLQSIPAALRWISYLSPFRYAWAAMSTSQLAGVYLFFTVSGVTVAVKGDLFLSIIGVDTADITTNVAALVGMYFGFALVTLTAAWLRARARRGATLTLPRLCGGRGGK